MSRSASAQVTVGLPVKNAEPYLNRALHCLRSQTFLNTAIIISDNDSSDDTVRIALRHAEVDGRIRVIRQATDIGAPQNFAMVLNEANSPYFMWAAHDDWWDPHLLERSVGFLERGVSYVVPNWRAGDVNRLRGNSSTLNPLGFLEESSARRRLLQYVNLHHGTHKCNLVYSIFRRDFLREVIGRQGLENDGLFGAVIAEASPGVVLDEVLFFKHFRPPRLSSLVSEVVSRRGRGRHVKRFQEAKEIAREEHVRQFPEVEHQINQIFSQYQYGMPRSGRILDPDYF